MRTLSSVLAAVALPVASGIREARQRVATKTVAGVPIYNYEHRHLQLEKGLEFQSDDGDFDWFLAFEKTYTDAKLNDFCKHDIGKAVCKRMGHPSAKGTPFVMIRSNEDTLRQVLESNSDQVLFAEPDLPVSVPEIIADVAPSSSQAPWNLNRIGLSESPFTGKGIHIYVMDTGGRSTHEDFGGRAIPTLDTLAGLGDPVECEGDVNCATDYHGHGTHTAGTAGGKKYGAAPESTLHVMKVCCGPYANVHAGMDWVALNGIRPLIMTVSLGFSVPQRSQASKMVVDNAVAAGVTVFVASANDNMNTCDNTYGFIPSAISVGATDSRDQRAGFSNWGPCNDIYAPGVAIPSAWKDSDTQTRSISGTSMATPLAAGVGALILEENPTFGPQEVVDLMLERSIKGVLTNLKYGDPNKLLSAV